MPPETRRIHNTERLLSCTFQSHKLTCFVCLAFQSTSASTEVLSLTVSPLWNLQHCGPVRQYGSMAATYGRCHAQVIRPNYEDICATLIKRPVVLPLSLLSHFLFPSLFKFRRRWSHLLCSMTSALAPRQQADCTPHTVVTLSHSGVGS